MRARAGSVLGSLGLAVAAGLLLGGGCVFASADDCALTLGFGASCQEGSTTGSVGSGGGDGGTSGSAGGTGGTTGCTKPETCPGVPEGPCKMFGTVTCAKGVCGVTYAQGDAASQVYGNCKRNVCDATGQVVAAIDTNNVYDDGNPCTVDACSAAGMPSNTAQLNVPCPTGFCGLDPYSNLPACLQCETGTCSGLQTTCSQGVCVPTHCIDTTQNSNETDVDCGNVAGCLKCAKGKKCQGYQDCASQVCTTGSCAAPTCSDNRQNDRETDVDCGGPLCSPCVDGYKCAAPADCVSGVCKAPAPGMPNVCQAPSCTDGVQNGMETGIDCGGTCPTACP